jgi:hypothetical protein
LASDVFDLLPVIERLAAVLMTLDGNQDRGLDLAKAIQDALDTEVGRARRPHGPDRGGAQGRDHGLGCIGDDATDTIALGNAGTAKRTCRTRDLAAQVAARHRRFAPVLAHRNNREVVVAAAHQDVLRESNPRVWKKARARHPIGVDHGAIAAGADYAGEFPHARPERRRVVDRQPVQRDVIAQILAGTLLELAGEPREVRGRDSRRFRFPDGFHR